jgi:hypothetical protein
VDNVVSKETGASSEILGAASVAYTDGNVGETRNIAQVGFLSKRDPQIALVEAAESAEIAKLVVHGVFPPLVAFGTISVRFIRTADSQHL